MARTDTTSTTDTEQYLTNSEQEAAIRDLQSQVLELRASLDTASQNDNAAVLSELRSENEKLSARLVAVEGNDVLDFAAKSDDLDNRLVMLETAATVRASAEVGGVAPIGSSSEADASFIRFIFQNYFREEVARFQRDHDVVLFAAPAPDTTASPVTV